jgi:hypothetical protein
MRGILGHWNHSSDFRMTKVATTTKKGTRKIEDQFIFRTCAAIPEGEWSLIREAVRGCPEFCVRECTKFLSW